MLGRFSLFTDITNYFINIAAIKDYLFGTELTQGIASADFYYINQAAFKELWHEPESIARAIFETSSVPRLLSILISGSSLAVAGLIMQCITCNRFVSPTTAGTMEWSKLGILLVMLYLPDSPALYRVSASFAVSLVGTAIFLFIINRIQSRSIILVPLVGIMLGALVNSGATAIAYEYDLVQNASSWLQGGFALVVEGKYEILYASVPIMLIAYFYADRFTIAGMGRSITVTLGLNHAHIVRIGLIIVALLTATSIVAVGHIPFIGLIVPNLVSLIRGDSIKHTLFDTAWLGAILVLLCDLAARIIIADNEIPVAVILSVVGSDVFLLLLLRKRTYA